MGNMEALYNTWKAIGTSGGDLSFFQNFFVKFYQAFIEADRWLQYLNGVKTTLLVTALALILGVALGVTVAILRTAHDQQRPGHRNPVLAVLNLVCKIYVTVIRGTPMMVQLLIMGFVIFASSRNFTMIGTLTLGINSGAYVSEIVRGGLMSVDKGQMEACITCGMSSLQGYIHVVLPQAFRLAIPSLANNFIECFKGSALCSMVGVKDMMLQAKMLANKSYRFMEVYLCVLLLYWVINMVFVAIQKVIEQKANDKY